MYAVGMETTNDSSEGGWDICVDWQVEGFDVEIDGFCEGCVDGGVDIVMQGGELCEELCSNETDDGWLKLFEDGGREVSMESSDGDVEKLEGSPELKRSGNVGPREFDVCAIDGCSEGAMTGNINRERELRDEDADEGWMDGLSDCEND